MNIHDPTSIDPARFAASVIVEAVCEYVCEHPVSGETLQRSFEGTLETFRDGVSPVVLGEIARALEAEGYRTEPEWRDTRPMIDLVQRVVERLRS